MTVREIVATWCFSSYSFGREKGGALPGQTGRRHGARNPYRDVPIRRLHHSPNSLSHSGCNMLQQERFPMQRPFCGRQLFQCELEHTLAVNVFDAPIGVVCLDTSEQLALDHHS